MAQTKKKIKKEKLVWRTKENVCCRFGLFDKERKIDHEKGCPNTGTENVEPVDLRKKVKPAKIKLGEEINGYIVAFGDAFNGITFEGPFDNNEDALDYAAQNSDGYEWHVVKIHKPQR